VIKPGEELSREAGGHIMGRGGGGDGRGKSGSASQSASGLAARCLFVLLSSPTCSNFFLIFLVKNHAKKFFYSVFLFTSLPNSRESGGL
jgi:hypothetical protein